MATGRASVLERNQYLLETAEDQAARALAQAYNQARRELIEQLLAQWVQLDTGAREVTPGRLLELYRQSNLIRQIDARLLALEQQTGQILRGVITASSELAYEQVERELALLPRELREALQPFSRIETAMVERFLPLATADLMAATGYAGLTLDRELQAGILQGESFPQLVKRLMGARTEDPSLWARGRTSAELGVRRMMIHANNAARLDYIAQARAEIPELQKQVVAVVQPSTTQTCLRAHGQIQPLERPFELTGRPRFADKLQHSPFHWRCRTAISAYHPVFERGGLTTANMQAAAQAELRRRD